jgi:hypothetical protein
MIGRLMGCGKGELLVSRVALDSSHDAPIPAPGNGRLSKRARANEFAALTDREVEAVEALYEKSFASHPWQDEEEGTA